MASRDQFQRFIFEDSQVRGAWVKLNDSYSEIGSQAPYPASVRRMLGESLVASVLMSSTLKFEGTLSLQAQGDGPLRTLMAECSHDRFIRGLARYDEHAVTEDSLNALLGEGRMAITISPDKGQRYQGVVPREEESLAGCLEEYFERSEQIPTSFFLFADENCSAGLMLQKLPGDTEQDSDLWDRLNHLASTVEAEELLTLDSETVLHRLFNEETVRLFDAEPVAFRASCPRERRLGAREPIARGGGYSILDRQGSMERDCRSVNQNYRSERKELNCL